MPTEKNNELDSVSKDYERRISSTPESERTISKKNITNKQEQTHIETKGSETLEGTDQEKRLLHPMFISIVLGIWVLLVIIC